MIRFRTTIVRT